MNLLNADHIITSHDTPTPIQCFFVIIIFITALIELSPEAHNAYNTLIPDFTELLNLLTMLELGLNDAYNKVVSMDSLIPVNDEGLCSNPLTYEFRDYFMQNGYILEQVGILRIKVGAILTILGNMHMHSTPAQVADLLYKANDVYTSASFLLTELAKAEMIAIEGYYDGFGAYPVGIDHNILTNPCGIGIDFTQAALEAVEHVIKFKVNFTNINTWSSILKYL